MRESINLLSNTIYTFEVYFYVYFYVYARIACENIRFSSLFAARSSARNVPSGEERGETDVFAG